jgi:hypothetical protein
MRVLPAEIPRHAANADVRCDPVRRVDDPARRSRADTARALGIDAVVQAGRAETPTIEAMAREHFTPEMLDRRTPDDRRQLVERFRADF